MKKILLLLSVTAIMVSCNKSEENEFTITGTVTGVENGKTVILQKADTITMGQMVSIDTVKIENGKFELKGTSAEPEIHALLIEGKGNIDFILEGGKITVEVDKDTLANSKVGGTYNNDEYRNYKTEIKALQKDLQAKSMAFQQANMEKIKNAQAAKDTAVVNALIKENQKIMEPLSAKNYTYAEKNPKSFLSVLLAESFFYTQEPDYTKIRNIYNGLESQLKNTRPGKSVKEKLDAHDSVEVGKKAPDFTATSADGKQVSLKESLGKVTIIDFWASWCAPCRQENPNVVALYEEFHSKGLNIVGVSLDQPNEEVKWKQAINQDKLTWTNVSNLKGWDDPIAKKYNVRSIPATFILDASGKIVAKDLRGEELKAKVKELLGA